MAQGDVKAGVLSSVSAGAVRVIQPPLGEHWLIKRVFSTLRVGTSPNVIPDVGVEIFDGTLLPDFGDVTAPENSATLLQRELNIGINNDVYLRLRNSGGTTAHLGYSGIQIK